MKVILGWLSQNWAPAIFFVLGCWVLIGSVLTADMGARSRGFIFVALMFAIGLVLMGVQALWRWMLARLRSKAGGNQT